MIKRRIVMALLALGTVGGFASGFASMSCHARGRHQQWEDRVAEVCVRAAKNVDAGAKADGSDK